MTARTPEDVDGLFGRFFNAGDVDALVALYEPSATLVNQDGSHATGHAAIRNALTTILAAKPTIAMHVVQVAKTADDIAMLYNGYSGTISGADGTPLTFTGKAIEVVRRQADGSWRFVIDDPNARG